MRISKMIISFMLVLCGSFAGAESSSSYLNKLKELDAAANSLRALIDERLTPKDVCDITSDQAFSMMNQLHSKIDEAVNSYVKNQRRKKANLSEPSWALTCEQNCHCGIFSSILESPGFEKLSVDDQKAYRMISTKASNQIEKALNACAMNNKNFCSSELLKQLRKDME